MLPDPIELPEQRAVFFPELVGRGPPPLAPPPDAVNAAIRRAGLEGKRKTNPVVDGQLVPRARKAAGHGPKALRKRRRDEPAASSSRVRRRR